MKKTFQVLGIFFAIWILFVSLGVNRVGLIGYYSLPELFTTLPTAKSEKYEEVVRLMNLRDVQGVKTDIEGRFVRLNYYGWLRKISDDRYMWMRDPENPYFITLAKTGESWHIIARPTRNSVYLKEFWTRIFTMDFRKLECHSYIYKSGADHQEIIKETTEPNQRLQTMRFKLPMNAIPQGPHV